MQFDFDEITDRRNTSSLKWDVGENELPMWVADMDFKAAPCITEALSKRIADGIFGYNIIPDEWYDAYGSWWKTRHGIFLEREWLMFSTGVVPTLSSMVRRFSAVAEGVIVQTPVYNIFFSSIENNGRRVVENRLKYDGVRYEMDFDDLEAKMRVPTNNLMILCNPHNPTGRIWSRQDLMRVATLAHENHVIVISDEIHCDLTDPGCEYIPYASVSEYAKNESITAIAPTKAFNIAGLQTSAISIPDPTLRNRASRAINTDEIAEANTFAIAAAIAAFTKGGEWLDELREYIYENKQTVREFLEKELPRVGLVSSEATYLLWLDCSGITENSSSLAAHIRRNTGLYLNAGSPYRGNGKSFLRLNIACPRSVLNDGLSRLKRGVESF